jgi:hypothetical protein
MFHRLTDVHEPNFRKVHYGHWVPLLFLSENNSNESERFFPKFPLNERPITHSYRFPAEINVNKQSFNLQSVNFSILV